MRSFAIFLICFSLPVAIVSAQVISPASPAVAPPQAVSTPAASVPSDTVVAEVNGQKFTAQQVDEMLKQFPPQMVASVRADPKRALGYLLLVQHLSAEAEKQHLDQESPLKENLAFSRMVALMQAEVNKVRNVDVPVSLDDEKKYYKEHPEKYEEAKVKVIYIAFNPPAVKPTAAPSGAPVRTEAEAKSKIEELRKQIEAGADFSKLAKENSDDKESAKKDGDFGVIKRGSPYPEPIKEAVFALKPGQVSAPIRQPNGFYLLRVDSVTTLPYDQVRTQIYDELKQQGFNNWMQGVQKQFDVKVENQAYFANKTSAPPAAAGRVPGPGAPPAH